MDLEGEIDTTVRRAAFARDVAVIVRIIAERHRAGSACLTWQLVREIREEALADLGLASRWPVELLDELVAEFPVPPFEGVLSSVEMDSLCEFARPIRDTFQTVAA